MSLAIRLLSGLAFVLWVPFSALAQDDPVPSTCLAMAKAVPGVTYVGFSPETAARTAREVTITYAGHSTYVIETPGGVRVATDFTGYYGADPVPDVITMNKAHSTHNTPSPDAAIAHVLRGWNPDGGRAAHALVVDDVYIRNVTTDIRRGGMMEADGNSIFVFEVAGLCIGHLGHLHHRLENAHYAAIGRLDVVMVPIDGGMTMSLDGMSEITRRLRSSVVLPMHRHATPMNAFTSMMGEAFDVDFRDDRALTVSLRSLPRRPTIVILEGV